MEINTDPKKIDEILTRGVHEVVTKDELREKLMSGKQLHLKLGTDVTGPQLHLGHSVVQRKIRDFQELGHKVTLIIGDFTTLVGDHSDKVDMREETSSQRIKENEETYKEQFFKTVIKEQTEIRHNSEWLKELNFNDVIELAKMFTIAQMLDRETFMLRYKDNKPIGLDEFLYPLMQGYDSVALNCDVEFGGTDQTFNLLAGRKIMENKGMTPQNIIVMKLLVGSDGRPMGKSLKNFIPVNASANDMFGMVMSIVDEVIFEYFELVTRVPMEEIAEMKKAVASGENPMVFKKRLAYEIVKFYHGDEAASSAQEHFEKTVQSGEIAEEDVVEVSLRDLALLSISGEDGIGVSGGSSADSENLSEYKVSLLEFFKKYSNFSSGEIKRVASQGGIELDGQKVTDFNALVVLKPGSLLKFGKRRFFRVV